MYQEPLLILGKASMVNTHMEKLEGALNAVQNQLEDRDMKFAEYQASIVEILSRLKV